MPTRTILSFVLPFFASSLASGLSIAETSTGSVLANQAVLNALPYPFDRPGLDNSTVTNITLPAAPAIAYTNAASVTDAQDALNQIRNATFIAYQDRFLAMTSNATVERAFQGGDFHEAVVYVPGKEWIWFCGNEGDNQYIIDLATNTLQNFTADPAIQNANGATYHDGKLYVVTSGGPDAAAGVYTIDVNTNKSSIVVNNYHGLRFNSANDVVVDKNSNVWFTDPSYGILNGFNPEFQQLDTAVYFYNATSKIVSIAANDFYQPNGLVLSPDNSILYVGDSGFAPTAVGSKYIYAYDVLNGRFLSNKRAYHMSTTGFPDGMKMAANGDLWVVSGGNRGLEIVDPNGEILGQVISPPGSQFFNFAFQTSSVEGEADTIWAVGGDSVWKISGLHVKGHVLQ